MGRGGDTNDETSTEENHGSEETEGVFSSLGNNYSYYRDWERGKGFVGLRNDMQIKSFGKRPEPKPLLRLTKR